MCTWQKLSVQKNLLGVRVLLCLKEKQALLRTVILFQHKHEHKMLNLGTQLHFRYSKTPSHPGIRCGSMF